MKGGKRTANEDVLEADIKCRVRVGVEDSPRFADDISRASVLVALGIANLLIVLLSARGEAAGHSSKDRTYVNVEHHAITLGTAYNGRDHDQRALGDEVPNATFLFLGLAAAVRLDIELEGIGNANEQQQAAEVLHERAWESHGWWASTARWCREDCLDGLWSEVTVASAGGPAGRS